MKKQTKKLTLEVLKVKSFNTNTTLKGLEKINGGRYPQDWDSHPMC